MEEAAVVDELDAFSTTHQLLEKPSVSLANVRILTESRKPVPVDLFDALTKSIRLKINVNSLGGRLSPEEHTILIAEAN
jgi:hypothetical protein